QALQLRHGRSVTGLPGDRACLTAPVAARASLGAPPPAPGRTRRGPDRLRPCPDRVTCIDRLDHDGVAGLLEHLTDQPVDPGKPELNDHGADLAAGDP